MQVALGREKKGPPQPLQARVCKEPLRPNKNIRKFISLKRSLSWLLYDA